MMMILKIQIPHSLLIFPVSQFIKVAGPHSYHIKQLRKKNVLRFRIQYVLSDRYTTRKNLAMLVLYLLFID